MQSLSAKALIKKTHPGFLTKFLEVMKILYRKTATYFKTEGVLKGSFT